MTHLPPLRQELTLTAGANLPDGSPSWMLHDPAANRFFQIGWPAFEILSRWSLDDPRAIVAAVNAETTLSISMDDVAALLRLLSQQHLLIAQDAGDTRRLQRHAEAHRSSHAMWLLKHYLMIRIPLWRPMPFLKALNGAVAFAYRPAFWVVVLGCALLGLALVSRRWDEFVHTFRGYADLSGLVGVGIALGFAKILHELAHAFTAYRHGCRVPAMGVAFVVGVPMLYTDTTEAWKVPSRADRLWIGAAGMLSEVALAALATVAWSLLPDGPLRAGAFLLATTTWIATLAINASPFMRFDGYFLLSDWLNVPNLHDRAFAFGRWWLGETLFGFGDPAPEPCTPSRRRFFVAFSFATWLYRVVVFMSIALVVYHAFFKLLGMLLFCVEFGWFIVRPVVQEFRRVAARRAELRWSRTTRRSALLATAALLVLLVPWRAGVEVPAVLGPAHVQGLYTVEAGYLADLPRPVQDGQPVHRGEVLAVLRSPDLDHRLAQARSEEKQLRWQWEQQPFDKELRDQGTALQRRWQAAQQAVLGVQAQIAQLTLRAPFDGRVQVIEDNPQPGSWLSRGDHLYDVVAPQAVKGAAYVSEQEVAALTLGQRATFVARSPELPARQCRIEAIDSVNMSTLDAPSVASVYGGPIPAEQDTQGHRLVPLQSTWRVRFGGCTAAAAVSHELSGTASLRAGRESLAGHGLRLLSALLRRELGF